MKIINYKLKIGSKGFTLIETLMAVAILAIVSGGVYSSYTNVLDIFAASYLNLTALSAIDNEVEVIRNMPYADVGIQGGSPPGNLLAMKDIVFGGVSFTVNTVVRNIDDPFDGTQGGVPDDTSPADYKLVEIEITCPTCARFIPAKITTTVAPVGLENITENGTLVVQAIDASGQPISGANVSVINNSVSPAININDVTGADGILTFIDIATSSAGYAITVSKSGYSTDRTYLPGVISNPNPLKPHATVLSEQTTEASFVIDRVSTFNMRTQDNFCAGVGSVDYLQTGQKLIGTNPNVYKYSVAQATNLSGDRILNNLEFDAYSFTNQDTAYEVSGFSPLMPIAIDPNGSYGLTWLMEPKSPSAIVVTVRDENNQLINDAKVTLSNGPFNEEKYTGRKLTSYTDWPTGGYDSKSDNMENNNPAGELHIAQIGGKYASMSDEWLISKTIDFGNANTVFYNLTWNPVSQQPQTGPDSLKIQIATNNDNASWNFTGPDGTSGTYYTSSNVQVHSSNNGKRYLRYKIILRTEDHDYTPGLEDISFNFSSGCIPDGQAYFSGLTNAIYTIRVEKAGYQNYTDNEAVIDADWEDYRLILIQ